MNEQDEALKPVKGCTTPNVVGGDTEKWEKPTQI